MIYDHFIKSNYCRIMYIFRQFFHYHVYVSLKYEELSIRHTGYTSWNIVQVASVGT